MYSSQIEHYADFWLLKTDNMGFGVDALEVSLPANVSQARNNKL